MNGQIKRLSLNLTNLGSDHEIKISVTKVTGNLSFAYGCLYEEPTLPHNF